VHPGQTAFRFDDEIVNIMVDGILDPVSREGRAWLDRCRSEHPLTATPGLHDKHRGRRTVSRALTAGIDTSLAMRFGLIALSVKLSVRVLFSF